MRIISKFHDYYDRVQVYGHDPSVIYLRESKTLFSNHRVPENLTFLSVDCDTRVLKSPRGDVTVNPMQVIFCGIRYPGAKVTLTSFGGNFTNEFSYHYTVESLENCLNRYELDLSSLKLNHYRLFAPRNKPFIEFLQTQGDTSLMDRAINDRCVCWLTEVHGTRYSNGYTEIIKDPCLADVQFFKIVNHTQAFQQIDMFISGVLAPENRPTVTIDDKYKVLEHGFDKWSFRKMPQQPSTKEKKHV